MTVEIESMNGKIEYGLSNGEWSAITAMGKAFGILQEEWDGDHGKAEGTTYTEALTRELAMRARQIGEAASYLEDLANNGGIRFLR